MHSLSATALVYSVLNSVNRTSKFWKRFFFSLTVNKFDVRRLFPVQCVTAINSLLLKWPLEDKYGMDAS